MGNFLFMLAGIVPMLVLLALAAWVLYQKKSRGERPPVPGKLLRSPGYTLKRKIDELLEGFTSWTFGAGIFSIGLAIILSRTTGKETTADVVILVLVFGLCAAICTVISWRKLDALRPLRLGLLGEQAVGEELQGLIAQGYRVFHDIPGEDKWNIDHVAVGPAGVFAVETKCRAKRPSTGKLREQDAVFDGRMIQFPWCEDFKAVEQARRNAKWLGGMLSRATGEKVAAQPLVALPGWFVTLKANSDVKVLNGKQLPGYITSEPRRFSEKLIEQIAYQLDQRCRDVEF